MPIRIPDKLPARETLANEGVAMMTESQAARQDIRRVAHWPAQFDA